MSASTSCGPQNPKNVVNKNLKNVTNKNLKNVTNKNLLTSRGAQIPKNLTIKNLPNNVNNGRTHNRVKEVGKNKMEGKKIDIGTTSNNRTLTEKRNVKEQIEKWRAERQARLAARILKNKSTKVEVSSTLFGTATPCTTLDKKISTVPSNLNSQNQQTRRLNTTIKKKTTIEVRQTTASRLRMNKLNPLHGILFTAKVPLENVKTPIALSKPSNSTKPKTILLPKTNNKLSEKKPIQSNSIISLSSKKSGRDDLFPSNETKKMEASSQKKETNSLRRNLFQTSSSAKSVHKASSVRRFLSVGNIKNIPDNVPLKFGPKMLDHKCSTPAKVALNPLEMTNKKEFVKPDSSQIHSSRKKSKVSLFTPDVNRKSVNVQTPHPDVLRERLVNWLAKRGKPIETFRHLCCFGQKHETKKKASQNRATVGVGNENLSPNVRQPLIPDKAIKEDICLQASNEVDESLINNQSQLQKVLLERNETVENILYDLRMLIISGYPRDHCEAWLHLIMKEYKNIDETAIYWECLAALEEVRGDFNTAVDYYGRAIMRGAKTENIDKSLDNLWEKFNTLNLDCKTLQNSESGKKSTNKLIDPCQMFKSTVIKFALQQKAVKQISANLGVEPSSLQYVATPVRRSTRKSVSKYKTSSNIEYVTTLHDLQPDVKNSILFHTNKALTPKV